MDQEEYNDVVNVHNKTAEDITIHWGSSEQFRIPANSDLKIPRIVAKSAVSHESYKGLEIVNEQGNTEPSQGSKESKTEDPGTKAVEEVLKPWSNNPDWDPMSCDMTEVDDYVSTFNLQIAENTPGETVRVIVEEHFIASFE